MCLNKLLLEVANVTMEQTLLLEAVNVSGKNCYLKMFLILWFMFLVPSAVDSSHHPWPC